MSPNKSGWNFIVSLTLLAAFWALPQPVVADHLGVTTRDVSFISAGATLAGTIVLPEHPYAAVVVVHGSGQARRMTVIARMLANAGIAALTYDKRGVGDSGGIYVGPEVGTNNVDPSNLALLAADASAAVTTLIAQLPATHGPVGLLGFSQAGWVIPLAAKRSRAVKFMVLFSGPVVTTHEQLRFQFYTAGNPAFWSTHTEAEAREHIRNDRDRFQFGDADPRESLAGLAIPGLWLFGGNDVQIPVHLSMERLAALKADGKPFESRLFPALGHNVVSSDRSVAFVEAVQWIKSIGAH